MSEERETDIETDEGSIEFRVDGASPGISHSALIEHLKKYCPSGWVNTDIKRIDIYKKVFTMRGNLNELAKSRILWP